MSTRSAEPFRVGIVGLGLMGRRMLGSLAVHSHFEAVAGFDLAADVTAAMASEFGFEACRTIDALLARNDLDLIYVATPPASHVDLSRRVLESGRGLFLEKPLAVDLKSAEELVTIARSSKLAAVMNFPFATLPGLRRFERELLDGTAGRPLRCEIVLHFSQWPRSWHKAGPWLAGDVEGGFSREVFSHFAYLTQRVLAPLELVHASVDREPGATETRVVAEYRAGEVPISLLAGAGGAAPDFNRWTLFCESRSYRVEDWAEVSMSDAEGWASLEPEAGESRGADSQLTELAALLRGEPSCLPTLGEGLGVMRAVEALLS
jgi:1,5-anhydro-D-fructose reductase (1,5-anhydro-D-mannitol-forming)